MSYSNLIYECITNAINEPKESDSVLSGFSGNKLLSVLQNLSRSTLNDETCYLEVGVYQGLSLLSVAKEIQNSLVYGIDNFAFFDKEKKNLNIINQRIAKMKLTNVNLINCDYEDALENLEHYIGEKKVGVYFIDGPHDYRSQLMCLMLIKPYLSDNAVIIIDDSNYRHVRQANRDFLITNPEFKLIYEAYTHSHPGNMNEEDKKNARMGWWNGVNIIIKDKSLPIFLPPTFRDRSLFENEHIMHSIKYPMLPIKFLRGFNFVGKILRMRFTNKSSWYEGLFKYMNTYSESLPESRFNKNFTNKK